MDIMVALRCDLLTRELSPVGVGGGVQNLTVSRTIRVDILRSSKFLRARRNVELPTHCSQRDHEGHHSVVCVAAEQFCGSECYKYNSRPMRSRVPWQCNLRAWGRRLLSAPPARWSTSRHSHGGTRIFLKTRIIL